jgi:putative methyltransferase (TIGR04325 family)
MNKNKIDVCYYSDSDVMIYDDLSKTYPFYKDFDAAYTMTEYQENFRWSASACCSFWKRETINKFCDFIIELYSTSKIEKLKAKWNYHQQNNIAGGICDMTLLYLFTEEINFYPLSKVMKDFCFDQNMKDDENYFKNEYKFTGNKESGQILKLVTWKDGKPYGYNNKLDSEIRFIVLTEYAKVLEEQSKQSLSLKKIIKKLIPVAVINKIVNILNPQKKNYGWFGNYKTWTEAKEKCTGYDDSAILEKVKNAVLKVKNGEAVYERDSVLFDVIHYSQPLLDVFNHIAKENSGVLHVVDFGGSLGSSYFQNRTLIENAKELKWSVVEQKHFVDCGKEFISHDNLQFFYTIEEALKSQKAQVLFLSSVIPYFEHPYELISKLLNYNFEYIIVDRTAFVESEKERITVQIVPEFIYKASYPSWFFNEQKFVNAFLGKYNKTAEFDSKFDPREQLEDGVWAYRKGFVFKKK